MKKIVRLILILILSVLFVVSTVNIVLAVSTSDANEPVDTSRTCSLKLTYEIDSQGIEGMEIELFRIADFSEDFQFTMTGDLTDIPVQLNGIKSQSEWDDVRDTVGSYIIANGVAPTASDVTDENGIVKFENLSVGLYYYRWTENDTVDQVYGFSPYVISVPSLGSDGKWEYDVDALPKPGLKPEPSTDKLTVVKLWRDGKYSSKRPESVSVDIFRNGQLFESVELTAKNNWTYTWETNGSYTWTCVERNITGGYSVTVQSVEGKTIQIINTLKDDPEDPPQTGESLSVYLWFIPLTLSGILLIVLGLFRKKAYEED